MHRNANKSRFERVVGKTQGENLVAVEPTRPPGVWQSVLLLFLARHFSFFVAPKNASVLRKCMLPAIIVRISLACSHEA